MENCHTLPSPPLQKKHNINLTQCWRRHYRQSRIHRTALSAFCRSSLEFRSLYRWSSLLALERRAEEKRIRDCAEIHINTNVRAQYTQLQLNCAKHTCVWRNCFDRVRLRVYTQAYTSDDVHNALSRQSSILCVHRYCQSTGASAGVYPSSVAMLAAALRAARRNSQTSYLRIQTLHVLRIGVFKAAVCYQGCVAGCAAAR